MARPIPDLDPMTAAEVASDDSIIIDDTSAGETKRIPVGQLLGLPSVGWTAAGEVWSFVSWNSTTKIGVVQVPTDATIKYAVDNFVRFSQATGGTKYGRILSRTATQLTLWMPLHTLTNETITAPNYSPLATPIGVVPELANGNPYKASVYRIGTYALSSGVATRINHDAEDYDTTGNFDATTNYRWVAPVSGYYDVKAQGTVGSAGMGTNESSLNYLFKNGSEVRRTDQRIGSGNANQINRHVLVDEIYLAAGDYIEHYGQCFGGRDITGGRNQTYMTISLKSRG